MDYYNSLLNMDQIADRIYQLPNMKPQGNMDDLPLIRQIQEASMQLIDGKALGGDDIPPKIYREGEKALGEKIHSVV